MTEPTTPAAAPEPEGSPPERPVATTPTPLDLDELRAGASGVNNSLNVLYDLAIPISVELGRTAMTVRDVLALGRGSVIPLERLAGEPVDVFVSDRKLAEGEVVVLGEHFGVRLTRVLDSAPRMPGTGESE